MLNAYIAGFAIQQDAFQFKFQPQVGVKYRYNMTMTDENGTSQIPKDAKLFSVFKVAGLKDGKFTIHQFIDDDPSGKTEPRRLLSFRADSLLNTEALSTSEETDAGVAGQLLAFKLIGAFGFAYNSSPVKVGDTWKPPFDAAAIAKDFIAATMPDANSKIDAEGNVSVSLDKLDEKVGTFKSLIHLKMDVTVDAEGQTHRLTMNLDCEQTATADRATGVPAEIDRKFDMTMKADAESHSMKLVMHLVRV
ncbi:MAG: hypothetical protein GC165_06510 [Armatimonadetes bacterium]|nr:hypothetical protein [Armatimonadota bacterium]